MSSTPCSRPGTSWRWASTIKDTVRRAILLGHDTDTTAAVAGGLAGIKFGVDGLPADWMDLLRGKELVEAILGRILGASP